MAELPEGCVLRAAIAKDAWPIRGLVFGAGLDPTQLQWRQFWVVEREGILLACGQLRRFADAQELGSLVVRSGWRRRRLGTLLAEHLIAQAEAPLYLECLGKWRADYFQRLGFEPVDWRALPPDLRRKFGLTQRLARFFRLPLAVMAYDQNRS